MYKNYNNILKLRLHIENYFIESNYKIQKKSFKNAISINIDENEYQKIKNLRTIALKKNNIGKKEKLYVNAKVTRNDTTEKVKLRLKGDNVDHISTNKWSLRIKQKGKSNAYSIQHPKTRSFMYEWIVHKCFEKFQIITTPYRFAQVYINSKNMGIYALEEHFTSKMLKVNNRTPGPILKFSEEIAWQEEQQLKAYFSQNKITLNGTGNIHSAKIEVFNNVKYKNQKNLIKKATDILNKFRNDRIELKKFFDLDLWSKYFAICEVFGANHAVRWHNVRFYYNPNTELIEPIGYDCGQPSNISILHETYFDNNLQFSNETYLKKFFLDTVFLKKYIHELENINSPEFVAGFYNELYQSVDKTLQKEFHYESEKTILLERQDYLKQVYNPIKPLYAYIENDTLMFANSYHIPVKLIEYNFDSEKINLLNTYLAPKSKNEILKFFKIKNALPNNKKLKVTFKLFGKNDLYKIDVEPFYDN